MFQNITYKIRRHCRSHTRSWSFVRRGFETGLGTNEPTRLCRSSHETTIIGKEDCAVKKTPIETVGKQQSARDQKKS